MLVTTLIVVPIHFMVDGELKLLLEPSAWRIGGFAVQIACLLALSRVVGGRLLPRRDAWGPCRAAHLDERFQCDDGAWRARPLGLAVCRVPGARRCTSGSSLGTETEGLGAVRTRKPRVWQPAPGIAGLCPGDQSDPNRRLCAGTGTDLVRGAGDARGHGLRRRLHAGRARTSRTRNRSRSCGWAATCWRVWLSRLPLPGRSHHHHSSVATPWRSRSWGSFFSPGRCESSVIPPSSTSASPPSSWPTSVLITLFTICSWPSKTPPDRHSAIQTGFPVRSGRSTD